ncbi:hypothetical protein [Paraburkholderia sp.]|uniref:hypothetical protein n=1 Tax=Paraburkholderia sp. TaxID=1926495 RepID=UPI00239E2252|nr:hypothetical protein [Paraburkholderia sp.]MDE1179120.1 hypothetical protein [Paraburkholderia sp.]
MKLWIQPCDACAQLYGEPASTEPHEKLTLNGVGFVKDATAEQHFTCARCGGVFARILTGPAPRQIWMMLNAGQH